MMAILWHDLRHFRRRRKSFPGKTFGRIVIPGKPDHVSACDRVKLLQSATGPKYKTPEPDKIPLRSVNLNRKRKVIFPLACVLFFVYLDINLC